MQPTNWHSSRLSAQFQTNATWCPVWQKVPILLRSRSGSRSWIQIYIDLDLYPFKSWIQAWLWLKIRFSTADLSPDEMNERSISLMDVDSRFWTAILDQQIQHTRNAVELCMPTQEVEKSKLQNSTCTLPLLLRITWRWQHPTLLLLPHFLNWNSGKSCSASAKKSTDLNAGWI